MVVRERRELARGGEGAHGRDEGGEVGGVLAGGDVRREHEREAAGGAARGRADGGEREMQGRDRRGRGERDAGEQVRGEVEEGERDVVHEERARQAAAAAEERDLWVRVVGQQARVEGGERGGERGEQGGEMVEVLLLREDVRVVVDRAPREA